MKKTIAKIMVAAMLVASVPAMTMPTLSVNAYAPASFTATYVKFEGSYDTNKFFTAWEDESKEYTYGSNATTDTLKLNSSFGMLQAGTGVWDTHLVYYTDEIKGLTSVGTPTTKSTGQVLTAGSKSISKVTVGDTDDLKKAGDYYDNTGLVTKALINSKGELEITLKDADDAKKKELAAGTNNTIEFTPWAKQINDEKYAPVFTIQIGEVYTVNKTSIENVSTPDGFITEATVTINKDQTATLVKVSDNNKKVTMKGQKIEISEVEVGGISYPVRKFEEQALKNAKMKRLTAKNVKNLETGCVRGCKKLTRVTMGSAKMRKIHSNAFLDCEKLKNIKINCKNLKAVGSKAFKGLKKNCVISIKAKKAKYNSVVKMIKKSGTDQVKFKRV
jgi:hypothetical protein